MLNFHSHCYPSSLIYYLREQQAALHDKDCQTALQGDTRSPEAEAQLTVGKKAQIYQTYSKVANINKGTNCSGLSDST